jgi:hypothetical protein
MLLDLVGVQEVCLDKGVILRARDWTFFCGKGNEKCHEQDFFAHHRIVSAVKRVEFVSDRITYIVLRGR